ncbi:hypothetical protein AwDysgo_03480 [Bacteroidales bacterium]|nr:hypothetical protein AwDysgo_03480 [Bacteroidales bacterium]
MEVPDTVFNGRVPEIITKTPEEIHYFDAIISAEVVSGKGYEVRERGFFMSLDSLQDFETPDNKIICGSGKGVYSKKIENLKADKQYFYKAYAINEAGINCGNTKFFNTLSTIPTLSTGLANNIVDGQASCYGHIILQGDNEIETLGIVWGKSPNIDEMENVAIYVDPKAKDFKITLENLSGDVQYFFSAFAKNNIGTGYGEVQNFFAGSIWTEESSFISQAREDAATFVLKKDLYISCGVLQNSMPLKSTFQYSIQNKRWHSIAEIDTNLTRKGPFSFVLGDYAFLGHGKSLGGHRPDDFYRYDRFDNTWQEMFFPKILNGQAMEGRYMATGFSLGNNAYVVGGEVSARYLNEVLRLNVNETSGVYSWYKMSDFPSRIYEAVSFVCNGEAYAGLGREKVADSSIELPIVNKTIWKYNEAGDSWEEFITYAPKVFTNMVVVKNKAYGIAYNDNQIWELDIDTKKWKAKSKIPLKNTASIGKQFMLAVDNIVYIGIDRFATDVYAYHPLWDN